jgi:multisubunit Na+/H+ antiporter MnhE subunit
MFPGTASVRLAEQNLRVHVIDQDLPHSRNLKDLEQRVSDIFKN